MNLFYYNCSTTNVRDDLMFCSLDMFVIELEKYKKLKKCHVCKRFYLSAFSPIRSVLAHVNKLKEKH